MSKTRVNRPNNTTTKLKPRMVHVSKTYTRVALPPDKSGLVTFVYRPNKGVTYRKPGGV